MSAPAYPPVDSVASCAKCGYPTGSPHGYRYLYANEVSSESGVRGEAIVRECDRCGYQWGEAVLS